MGTGGTGVAYAAFEPKENRVLSIQHWIGTVPFLDQHWIGMVPFLDV